MNKFDLYKFNLQVEGLFDAINAIARTILTGLWIAVAWGVIKCVNWEVVVK